jgi:hypothetical protein
MKTMGLVVLLSILGLSSAQAIEPGDWSGPVPKIQNFPKVPPLGPLPRPVPLPPLRRDDLPPSGSPSQFGRLADGKVPPSPISRKYCSTDKFAIDSVLGLCRKDTSCKAAVDELQKADLNSLFAVNCNPRPGDLVDYDFEFRSSDSKNRKTGYLSMSRSDRGIYDSYLRID